MNQTSKKKMLRQFSKIKFFFGTIKHKFTFTVTVFLQINRSSPTILLNQVSYKKKKIYIYNNL